MKAEVSYVHDPFYRRAVLPPDAPFYAMLPAGFERICEVADEGVTWVYEHDEQGAAAMLVAQALATSE